MNGWTLGNMRIRAEAADIAAELVVMAAIGLVMGLLGPFGTYALPAPLRIATWLGFALAGYACFRPVIAAAHRLRERTGLSHLAAYAIACTLAALPMTLVVAWSFSDRGALLDRAAALYPSVLLSGGLATMIQVLLFRSRPVPPAEAHTAAEAPPAAVPFLDRLPPQLGGPLLCLEMEDHYVRAHTPHGSDLILMRMRDAVAELAGVDGARVHRSWWVARAAVADVVRRDRAVSLRLVDGREVPVARNAVPELRARGWFG